MQKGKYGFSLWLYPFISLWALYLEMNLIPFLIAGFVIALEKDEWAIKQCLHTIMICAYYSFYRFVMGLFMAIPVVGAFFIVVDFIVDLAFLIVVFVFGFSRLKKGEGITMLGMGVINRAFGMVQQYAPVPSYQQQPAPPAYQPDPIYQPQPAPVAPAPVAPAPVAPAPAPVAPPPFAVAPVPVAVAPAPPAAPAGYTPPAPPVSSGFIPPPPPPPMA